MFFFAFSRFAPYRLAIVASARSPKVLSFAFDVLLELELELLKGHIPGSLDRIQLSLNLLLDCNFIFNVATSRLSEKVSESNPELAILFQRLLEERVVNMLDNVLAFHFI